ncbi:hypothetical protein [Microbacterium testaceum]|uniref:Protein kinase domain-containing protein n=1 Tax=Microbacterium testaceum TaxID=2033 RepID=A0A147FBC6_MICTE|nr:hypothetical protein [Microbacterium testaceum]KTS13745.1 hypothetical protein RSA3_03360 [Microbacterium testaceum]
MNENDVDSPDHVVTGAGKTFPFAGVTFALGAEIRREGAALAADVAQHVKLFEVQWTGTKPRGMPDVLVKYDNGTFEPGDASTAERESAVFRLIEKTRVERPDIPGFDRVVRCFGMYPAPDGSGHYFLLERHGQSTWSRMREKPDQRAALARGILRDGLTAVRALAEAGLASRDAHPANLLLGRDDVDGQGPLTLIDFGHAYATRNHAVATANTLAGWAWVQPAALNDKEDWGKHAGLADDAFSIAMSAFIVATGGKTAWFIETDGGRMLVNCQEHKHARNHWRLGDVDKLVTTLVDEGCDRSTAELVALILHANADLREANADAVRTEVSDWIARVGPTIIVPRTFHPTDDNPVRVENTPRLQPQDTPQEEVERAREWLAARNVNGIAEPKDFLPFAPWSPPSEPQGRVIVRRLAFAARRTGAALLTAGAFILGAIVLALKGLVNLLRAMFHSPWRTLAALALVAIVGFVVIYAWSQWWYRPFFVRPWTWETYSPWQLLIVWAATAIGLVGALLIVVLGRAHVGALFLQGLVLVVVMTLVGAGSSWLTAVNASTSGGTCADGLAVCLDEQLPAGWELQPQALADGAGLSQGAITYDLVSVREDCLTAQVSATQSVSPATAQREIPWADGSRTASEDAAGTAPLRFSPAGTTVWQRYSWSDESDERYDRARAYDLVGGRPFGGQDQSGVARAVLGLGLTQVRVTVRESACPADFATTADQLGQSLLAAVHPIDAAVADPRLIQQHTLNGPAAGVDPSDLSIPVSADLTPEWPWAEDAGAWQLAVNLRAGHDGSVLATALVGPAEGASSEAFPDRPGWTSDGGAPWRTYKSVVTHDGQKFGIFLIVPAEHADDEDVASAANRFMDGVTLFGIRPDGSA